MPTGRDALAIGVLRGRLYAIDGHTTTGPTRRNEAYNPATDMWTDKTPDPTRRLDLAAGVVNGVIYVIGGYNNRGQLNTVEAFTP
jgi:hypothetical protein